MTRKTGWTMSCIIGLGLWVLIIWGIVALAGCEQLMRPVSNEPNAPPMIDPIIQTTQGVGAILSPLWPPAGMLLTAVGGLFAGYKKLKPKLDEAKTQEEKYLAGGKALSSILEDIKTQNPNIWKQIAPKINLARMQAENIGAAIDGFRGKA